MQIIFKYFLESRKQQKKNSLNFTIQIKWLYFYRIVSFYDTLRLCNTNGRWDARFFSPDSSFKGVTHIYIIANWYTFFLCLATKFATFSCQNQRYTYRVLQTIQKKLILLCVWADPAILGSTKTALNFKYEV